MERYIAIDNVCAWPNLTLMPNGDIIATIFNQPCHGRWEGDVECWAGTDGGRFWTRRGVPAPHEAGTNRMNVAAGLARNGDLIVLASGWSNRPSKEAGEAGEVREFHDAKVLAPWVCRSRDGGATWKHAEGAVEFEKADWEPIPFGDIVQLPDGTLGVSFYTVLEAGEQQRRGSFILRSADDGKTWGDAVLISEGVNETDLLVLPDGDVLAAARTCRGGWLKLFRSADSGRTWQFQEDVTGPSMHPAHLLNLNNQHTLLTYGLRHSGFRGVGIRSAADNGKTWYSPAALVTCEGAVDVGYPSSVQLEDGTIVTAYYARRCAAHQRYHVGVVRWTFEEGFARDRA